MDPSHRDANAPPPYADPAVPYTAPTLTEKSGAPPPGWANPDVHNQPGYPPQGSVYPQLSPGYPPQGPPQGSPQPYRPQGSPQPHHPQGPPQGYPPQGPPPQGAAYYPQGGYAPPPQQINLTAPYVVQTLILGPDQITTDCPKCEKRIQTEVTRTSNSKTHLFALVLCLIGCWCCVCVPYCMASCTDTTHRCPSCKHFLGVYRNSL